MSDSEYDFLKTSAPDLKTPDWKVRKGGSVEDGTRHINRHCQTCRGEGQFKFWDETREGVVDYICPCLDQWTLTRLLASAGLRRRDRELGWGDLDVTGGIPVETLEKALEYRDNIATAIDRGRGMILTGKSGSGKTMIATLLLKAALAKGYDGHFIGVIDFIQAYAGGWGNKEKDQWFNQRIKGVDLLVIDDLGVLGETNLAERALNEVIRHRLSSLKPTIFTSEMGIDRLRTKYEGIVGRADEGGIHVVSGENWRRRAQERSDLETKLGITRPVVLQ